MLPVYLLSACAACRTYDSTAGWMTDKSDNGMSAWQAVHLPSQLLNGLPGGAGGSGPAPRSREFEYYHTFKQSVLHIRTDPCKQDDVPNYIRLLFFVVAVEVNLVEVGMSSPIPAIASPMTAFPYRTTKVRSHKHQNERNSFSSCRCLFGRLLATIHTVVSTRRNFSGIGTPN